MNKQQQTALSWLTEVFQMVREELSRLEGLASEQRPDWEREYQQLQRNRQGRAQSLANPDLDPDLRRDLEEAAAADMARMKEIEQSQQEQEFRRRHADELLDVSLVIERIERLQTILGEHNPTAGNFELSLHIDRIDCSPDGTVAMKTCKLGALAEVVDLVSNDASNQGGKDDDACNTNGRRRGPRRRGRLRILESNDDRAEEVRALADYVADPDRFAGLGEEWFWTDEFHIPDKPLSWAASNAEAVFKRRQEAKLSYAKLGEQFGVTAATARAAVLCYLEAHPEARDEVNLPRGGKRPPKFDLSKFGHEARELWEADWSKLKLAEKYKCSPPTIDKAIEWSYQQEGRTAPTCAERKEAKVRQARQLLDAGRTLEEIKQALGVSDVTARAYLRASFEAEGKPMPDLRKRS